MHTKQPWKDMQKTRGKSIYNLTLFIKYASTSFFSTAETKNNNIKKVNPKLTILDMFQMIFKIQL